MQGSDLNSDVPPSEAEAQAAVSDATGAALGLLPIWALVLGAGTLAGVASWVAGEPLLDLFQPPYAEVWLRGSAMRAVSWHDEAMANARNTAVSFTVLGGLLGALLGAAGGLGRKDGRAAAMAGLLGLVLGAAASGGMTMLILSLYNTYLERQPEELIESLAGPLLVHLGVWTTAGGMSGLAFAIGYGDEGRRPGIVMGGFLGAALGTVVYEFIAAIAFPMVVSTRFISVTPGTRLLARAAVTVFTAAGVAMGLTMKLAPERYASPAPTVK